MSGAMMRFPGRGAVVGPQLGGSPPITASGIPQYPWSDGELLYAEALNAAIGSGTTSVTNVINFGADPTGAADSTAAFRAAIAAGGAIYIPTGNYIISDVLTLQPGQSMYGDGRTVSMIQVYQNISGKPNFNLAADAVIQTTGSGQLPSTGVLRDFGFWFSQPDTSVRANIVPFPWAIDASGCDRCMIVRVRVNMANKGFHLPSGYVIDCEMWAFTVGLFADGPRDVLRIKGFHFWQFNFSSVTYPGLYAVAADGNTLAGQFGRVDGLFLDDWFQICSNLQFTANDITGGQMGNLSLDVASVITFNGTGTHNIEALSIQNLGNTATTGMPAVTVNGGAVTIDDLNIGIGGYNTAPGVQVTGAAELIINGGVMNINNANVSAFVGGGAHLRIRNVRFYTTGTANVPLVVQNSGDLVVTNCDFGSNATSGVAVQISTDSAANRIFNNSFGAFTCNFPTTYPVQGFYSYFKNALWSVNVGQIGIGTGSGTAGLVFNGGSGGDRTIHSQSAGVIDWEYGENGAKDWIVNRWSGGASVGNPVVVRNATGNVEIANTTANPDTAIGNQAGMATSATTGYLYIPTMVGGQPTGTPANPTLGSAMCFDRANHKLWIWNNSTNTWQSVTLA